MAYGILVCAAAVPVLWLTEHDEVDVIILAAVAAIFFGIGTYLLFIRKKPLTKTVVPESFTSRQIVRRGPAVIPLFVLAGTVTTIAALFLLVYLIGDEGDFHELMSVMIFLVLLNVVELTHELILNYLALCDYYSKEEI